GEAECPTTVEALRYVVSVERKEGFNPLISIAIDPEIKLFSHDPNGITFVPTVTIEAYRVDTFVPNQSFEDDVLRVEIMSMTSTNVAFRVHNTSARYVDVQTVGVHVNG